MSCWPINFIKKIKYQWHSNIKKTEVLAGKLDIPLFVESNVILDLAVDGADQVDENLNLIKGLGHALLQEKMWKFILKADNYCG